MYDIITVGDIKLDTFVVIEDASVQCELKMPECKLCIDYGKKIDVPSVESQVAGSAPNVAIALSRMGKKSGVISVMGKDSTRPLAFEKLEEENVATRYIDTLKDEQSSYSVVLNYKGEKTILTKHIEHDYRLPKKLPKTKWLYVCEMGGGYEKLYKEVIAKKKENGMKIAMNPGGVQVEENKKVLRQLIKETDLLFVNKQEAQRIAGKIEGEMHRLAHAVHKIGPETVVITDGRNGAYAFDGEKLYFAPMFPGERIEATGAGDSFASGYLGALMHGEDAGTALAWGSVNAASVVQYVGPTPGLLSAKEIKKQLKERPSYKVEEM